MLCKWEEAEKYAKVAQDYKYPVSSGKGTLRECHILIVVI